MGLYVVRFASIFSKILLLNFSCHSFIIWELCDSLSPGLFLNYIYCFQLLVSNTFIKKMVLSYAQIEYSNVMKLWHEKNCRSNFTIYENVLENSSKCSANLSYKIINFGNVVLKIDRPSTQVESSSNEGLSNRWSLKDSTDLSPSQNNSIQIQLKNGFIIRFQLKLFFY